MTEYKLLISSTLLFVFALLMGGIFFPESFAMSLAGTDLFSHLLRGVIVVLLITLLVTTPPRSLSIRIALGAWALLLAVTALQLLFSYRMQLLDTLVFLEVAIIFGLEALETRTTIPVRQKETKAHKIPVMAG